MFFLSFPGFQSTRYPISLIIIKEQINKKGSSQPPDTQEIKRFGISHFLLDQKAES